MNIAWRQQAADDLADIFNYGIERNPPAALQQYTAIRQKVELLGDQPGLGRPGRVPYTRELIIPNTPYTVDRAQATVIILRVLHSARQWPTDLGQFTA